VKEQRWKRRWAPECDAIIRHVGKKFLWDMSYSFGGEGDTLHAVKKRLENLAQEQIKGFPSGKLAEGIFGAVDRILDDYKKSGRLPGGKSFTPATGHIEFVPFTDGDSVQVSAETVEAWEKQILEGLQVPKELLSKAPPHEHKLVWMTLCDSPLPEGYSVTVKHNPPKKPKA